MLVLPRVHERGRSANRLNIDRVAALGQLVVNRLPLPVVVKPACRGKRIPVLLPKDHERCEVRRWILGHVVQVRVHPDWNAKVGFLQQVWQLKVGGCLLGTEKFVVKLVRCPVCDGKSKVNSTAYSTSYKYAIVRRYARQPKQNGKLTATPEEPDVGVHLVPRQKRQERAGTRSKLHA